MGTTVTPIQESFAAGEISPKLFGRRSIEGYRSGTGQMTNMVADSRGPARSRRGARYANSYIANNVRLGVLTGGSDANLLAVFTDFKLDITGILGSVPALNSVQNGNFDEQGANWVSSATGGGANVNFNTGNVVIDGGLTGNAYIAQQLAITAGLHTVIVETDGISTYHIKIGSTENSTDFFEEVTSEARAEVEVNIASATPWITIERVGTDTGARQLTVFAVIVTDDVQEVSFSTPYPEGILQELYFVQAPSGETVYILHPDYEPQKIEISAGVVTFGPVVFTSPPAVWTGDNWPGAGTVFEGRLWLGGTPDEPQTFWASRSGLLEDFTTGQLDDDSLEFTLSEFGGIVWIIGTKNLLIGTARGEHIVTSEGGVITPTDINIEQQSAYGSKRVQPVQIGDQVFYISADATKVRGMQYDWSSDNWLSKDLTFFSEHITKSGIRSIAWAPNPDNLLLCVLEDGTMAWLSYERSENVWGWHKHTTQGRVIDVATGFLTGFSYSVTGIIRVDGEVYIESLTPPNETQYSFDSWSEQEDLVNPFTVVTGLEHLEGFTVQVLADGAVSPDQVVTGGQITLPAPANTAAVGLQYNSIMQTLPIESGARTGSSLAYTKRYNQVIVGLLDSANPIINGRRAPSRTPSTPMNTREPNRTGSVSAYLLGWSEGAIITIEQDLPLPLTVIYIGGELPQDFV